MNPFDFVKDASYAKKNLMRGTENDTLAEKAYNPWVANIAFSYFPDSILQANLMNQFHHLDNYTQYLYYINSLRAKNRFAKWHKKEKDEDLELVCQTYDVNVNVAKEYLSLLTQEQLDLMKKEQEKGGTK